MNFFINQKQVDQALKNKRISDPFSGREYRIDKIESLKHITVPRVNIKYSLHNGKLITVCKLIMRKAEH